MVTVKIFGTFRLDSGIKQMQAEADRVRDLYPLILAEAARQRPGATFSVEELKSCVVIVNGKSANGGTRLKDGDLVSLIHAAAGG